MEAEAQLSTMVLPILSFSFLLNCLACDRCVQVTPTHQSLLGVRISYMMICQDNRLIVYKHSSIFMLLLNAFLNLNSPFENTFESTFLYVVLIITKLRSLCLVITIYSIIARGGGAF